MSVREKLNSFLTWYRELVSVENGWAATLSPFVLGLLVALLPHWWLHALVSALFMGYQAIEMWVRLKLGKNGERVGELLSDIRQYVAGYIIGVIARYIGVNI